MYKIAIVHDWFITIGGAEKVLKQLILEYPDADVFCSLDHFNKAQRDEILNGKIPNSTLLSNLPFSKRYYRPLTLLFYKAIEQFDLSKYDLIISSSHAVAKGIRKHEGQVHVCYCHTPMRYVWNMKKTYLKQIHPNFRKLALYQINNIKKWDYASAIRVDQFIANSRFIAARIKKNYNQSSEVINPPVDTTYFHPAKIGQIAPDAESYYLVVSRLVHYKRIDLIIGAFNGMNGRRLIIIGAGPQLRKLKKMAAGNITFLGHQPTETLRLYMQHAEAVLFAAIEDFGITCLEAQACGTPVIAYDFGGYRETVLPNATGILFTQQNEASIRSAVHTLEKMKPMLDRKFIRKNCLRYAPTRFRKEIRELVTRKMAGHVVKG